MQMEGFVVQYLSAPSSMSNITVTPKELRNYFLNHLLDREVVLWQKLKS